MTSQADSAAQPAHTTPNGMVFEIYAMGSADKQWLCSPVYEQPCHWTFKAARKMAAPLDLDTSWTKENLIEKLDRLCKRRGR